MNKSLIGLTLLALLVAAGCDRQGSKANFAGTGAPTRSSFDLLSPGDKPFPAHAIKFEEVELAPVLALYAEVSGRSVIRGRNVPNVKVTFSNQSPMSAVEVLRALDTVLAAQGIATVYLGTQYVKVVQATDAHMEAGPVVELPPDQLPDSSSYLIYIVKLKHVTVSQAVRALQPFAQLPNSIIGIGSDGTGRSWSKANLPNLPAIFGTQDQSILILRDYSSNVRSMLQVLEKLDAQ